MLGALSNTESSSGLNLVTRTSTSHGKVLWFYTWRGLNCNSTPTASSCSELLPLLHQTLKGTFIKTWQIQVSNPFSSQTVHFSLAKQACSHPTMALALSSCSVHYIPDAKRKQKIIIKGPRFLFQIPGFSVSGKDADEEFWEELNWCWFLNHQVGFLRVKE